MLETLYSTGMRRMELLGLSVWDLDAERGTVLIRLGKGRKDRMVPIGERALSWIARYLDTVRPELVVPPDDGTLFLSSLGEALSPDHVTHLVRRYVAGAELGKQGACHLFRHTVATLDAGSGADIRFIQELLGHARSRPRRSTPRSPSAAQGDPQSHPPRGEDGAPGATAALSLAADGLTSRGRSLHGEEIT